MQLHRFLPVCIRKTQMNDFLSNKILSCLGPSVFSSWGDLVSNKNRRRPLTPFPSGPWPLTAQALPPNAPGAARLHGALPLPPPHGGGGGGRLPPPAPPQEWQRRGVRCGRREGSGAPELRGRPHFRFTATHAARTTHVSVYLLFPRRINFCVICTKQNIL